MNISNRRWERVELFVQTKHDNWFRLFLSSFSFLQEKYISPSHVIRDLEIFAQCYFRWMPILEIRSGGAAQIDLFNRMLLSNINKLQRAIETGDWKTAELQNDVSKIPNVNSYFPFSMTDGGDDATNLHELLIDSSDVITEGSLFEYE